MTCPTLPPFAANGIETRVFAAYLCDTDVLIDYLRGNKAAVRFFEEEATGRLLISAISVAELYAGVKDGEEKLLADFVGSFETIEVDTELARQGGLLRNRFGKSHGVGLADALIAAGCRLHNARLVTLNRKHFPMLEDVLVPYQKKQ